MIEYALANFLRADPIVGDLCGGRIYPIRSPQKSPFPHVTYIRLGTDDIASQDGPSSLTKVMLQVDVWALSYDSAKGLQDAIASATGGMSGIPDHERWAALDGFKGRMAGRTVAAVFVGNERDGYEADAHAGDVGVFRCSLDLEIWYEP